MAALRPTPSSPPFPACSQITAADTRFKALCPRRPSLLQTASRSPPSPATAPIARCFRQSNRSPKSRYKVWVTTPNTAPPAMSPQSRSRAAMPITARASGITRTRRSTRVPSIRSHCPPRSATRLASLWAARFSCRRSTTAKTARSSFSPGNRSAFRGRPPSPTPCRHWR